MKREAIYSALLAQLQELTGPPYNLKIPLISRDWLPWDNCPSMPAVFLAPVEELAIYERSKIFIKWQIKVDIWIYAPKQGQQLGVQTMTIIQDAIETLLMPQQGSPQAPVPFVNTLGGLVHQLAISGPTQISPGYLGPTAVAKIPVEIITANP